METEDCRFVFLFSDSVFADRKPYQVTTILGSCISVCLWDSRLKFGGINHFMLSCWNGEGLPTPRFGDIAIDHLIKKMTSLGSDKKHLHAKIFGGAEVIESSSDQFRIGFLNAKIAEEILKKENIPIVNADVGGNRGRKIIFKTQTGEVLLKYLDKGLSTSPDGIKSAS